MQSHLRRKIALAFLVAAFAASGRAAEGDDVGDGYRKRLDDLKQKMGDFVKDADSKVVSQNKKAVDQLAGMTSEASGVSAELSAIAPTPGDPSAAGRNTPIKTHASTAQGNWKTVVSNARQIHKQASEALKSLPSGEEAQKIEKELKAIRALVDRDRQQLTCPGRLLTNRGDLKPHADQAMEGKQSACPELQNDEADLKQQEDRWKKFKQELESGSVKQQDDRTEKVLDQADRDVDASGTMIGAADPSTGTGFSQAGSQTSRCAALSDPDAGYMMARQAVDDTQYFK